MSASIIVVHHVPIVIVIAMEMMMEMGVIVIVIDSDSDSDGGEPPKPSGTGKLHLDRRAAAIADAVGEGSNDDLLTTVQVANWLGVSPQWLEIGRGKNYGPPFMRLAPQVLRYKRGAVIDWLKDREYAHTWQYTDRRSGRAKKSA